MARVEPLSEADASAALEKVEKTEWTEVVHGINLDGINIPFSVLEELDEQDAWSTDFGAGTVYVPYDAEKVLLKYGLVNKRTRGSVYGNENLKNLLNRVYYND